MFGKSKEDRDMGSGAQRSTTTQGEATSTILSGVSIVGKIVGNGAVTIFGHVEGELHASTVVIAEGAEMEGDIVAEELTISGNAEGTIRANRVKLNVTAGVDGDIFHRSMAMRRMRDSRGRRDDWKMSSKLRRASKRTVTSLRTRRSTATLEPTDHNRRINPRWPAQASEDAGLSVSRLRLLKLTALAGNCPN